MPCKTANIILVKSKSMNELNNLSDFDSKGWYINAGELTTPERGVYPYHYIHDKLFESPDKRYACLFYTINEYRMGAEAGLIAIFQDKKNPILLCNPKNQWFDFQGESSVYFFDDLIFLRKLAYNKDEKLSGTPFVVFDMSEKAFGFVDFDWSSIYYSPIRVSDVIYRYNLDSPSELKHPTLNIYNGEVDLSTIIYYPFNELGNMADLYFDEKRAHRS